MKRREFLSRTACGLGAAWFGAGKFAGAAASPVFPAGTKFSATDTVVLGKTGIRTSRLAMGTGTVGSAHHSHQTALGVKGLSDLLLHGYDQGLRFFDTADSYGSHPHVAEALKQVQRDKVVVMTKSWNRTPDGVRADLDRFRRELGTDYIDVLLMHCLTEGDWTTRYRAVMDTLEEAREKGIIRAHGCSCHTIEALRAAAQSDWVQVDLARINPVGEAMDSDPDTVVSVLRQMKASGKGIIGMKILGQGKLRDRPSYGINYALSLDLLDAFTIGAESIPEQNDLMKRIAAANA